MIWKRSKKKDKKKEQRAETAGEDAPQPEQLRDYAEALERAVRIYMPCQTCKHRRKPGDRVSSPNCSECVYWSGLHKESHWEFDDSKF